MSDGFDYQEPDKGNTLAAVRSSSGVFCFQNAFDDGEEAMTVTVEMSPTEAERFARWILLKLGPQGSEDKQ